MNDKKMDLSPPTLAAQPGPAKPPAGRPVNSVVRGVAIAVAVILALLGGLAAYETYNRGPAPELSKAPAAPVPAAQPVPPQPPVAPEPAAAAAPPPEPAPATLTDAEPAAGPGRSAGIPEGGSGKPAAESRRRAADRPAAVVPSAAATGPASAQPDTRAAGVPGVWFVQAGVYNNLANAEAMRDKLAANGFPALMEIRVLAGPYPDRAEAQNAQRKLAELGVAPTLLVPPRKPASPPSGR